MDAIENKTSFTLDARNNWWGENLEALQQREQMDSLDPIKRLDDLNRNKTHLPDIQLALDKNQAKKKLNNWHPWRLIHILTGHSPNNIIRGLAMSLDSEASIENNGIGVRASIQIE